MKGIILAGGSGTRLWPLTKIVSKQLMPIFNKPMIYYPLSTLINLGINEILLISDPMNITSFKKLLNNGSQFGISIKYCVQKKPNGLAEAYILAEDFLKKSSSVLILGDNIFYSDSINKKLNTHNFSGSKVFLYKVKNPNRYGVAKIDKNKIIKIVEKPKKYFSSYAITGLYFYDNKAVNYAKKLKPSKRGELEITDLNQIYLKKKELNYTILENGSAWLDTGTHESLIEAGQFIQTLEHRQNLLIGSPEMSSLKQGFLKKNILNKQIKKYIKNQYYNSILEQINLS